MRPKIPQIEPNWLDKALTFVSPDLGLKRLAARTRLSMLGSYTGARRDRAATENWRTSHGSADADILPDLPVLRERCRDLSRNNPLSRGAINTKVTNVIGTGLTLQARIDYEFLGMTSEEGEAWERNTEREFKLWAESQDCDRERTLNFFDLQDVAFRQVLENGDVFILLPYWKRPGVPYGTCIQLIEADRVCNPNYKMDSLEIAGGVEKDAAGAPTAYHILSQHPGDARPKTADWQHYPAYSPTTGRRNILHLLKKERPEQSRGVPDLAPVLELLKQLGQYTDAEVMAAVVSGMISLFVKSDYPPVHLYDGLNNSGAGFNDPDSGSGTRGNLKLGPGQIAYLASGEEITSPMPGRPNQAFDPFVMSILRQIGVALELPVEVLIKHFTSSYSASRAALLEAWKFFMTRRVWMAAKFCQPIYEEWLAEAVALGRIKAPGYLNGDVAIRKAYAKSEWIGPARGQIDELKEVNAAIERVNAGFSTIEQETEQMNGGNWLDNHNQRVKEATLRKEAGLDQPVTPPKGLVEPGKDNETE
jgi:lambda family phage portal protein